VTYWAPVEMLLCLLNPNTTSSLELCFTHLPYPLGPWFPLCLWDQYYFKVVAWPQYFSCWLAQTSWHVKFVGGRCYFLTHLVRNGHLEICSKVASWAPNLRALWWTTFVCSSTQKTKTPICFCAFDSIEPKRLLVLLGS
jgi:hypothetical protein